MKNCRKVHYDMHHENDKAVNTEAVYSVQNYVCGMKALLQTLAVASACPCQLGALLQPKQ